MLKKILLGLAVVVAVLVIVIVASPADFRVSRSTTIEAPADVVLAQINDFHKWAAWSPWDKMDPGMKRTFSGAPSGTGAAYAWVGNDKVGEGRMTIVESKPGERVAIKLEFLKPFEATNATEFSVKPAGTGVRLEWSMAGTKNFVSKAFGLVMSMDKMIGGDFEKGLSQLKDISEAEARRLHAEAELKAKADAAAAAAAAAVAAAAPTADPSAAK